MYFLQTRKLVASLLIRHRYAMMCSDSRVHLQLLPSPRCFFDEPVQVKVDGLSPGQSVELRSKVTDDKGVTFRASATYRADGKGEIIVDSSSSLSGSYTGIEPMGLFWSMRPETPHSRLIKWSALNPLLVDIEVMSSGGVGEVLAKATNERLFMRDGVRRVPLKDGRIRGTLFVPPGPGPFPGVLDVYTLGGGPSEPRASLLANKGFVVLALAFYRFQDLPKTATSFDLEYFEEGIAFLRKQPEVKGPEIGLISISKSGDLALSMASFLPGVAATVTINGCNANVMFPLHYKGMVIPALMPDMKKVIVLDSGILNTRDALQDPMAKENLDTVIPIERASGNFMFVVSEDDQNWNTAYYAEQAAKRLTEHGKENYEIVSYPKAGHYVDVPYMPHYPSGIHAAASKVVMFGGEPKANAEAQVDLWRRVQEFFRKHLDSGNSYQKAKL